MIWVPILVLFVARATLYPIFGDTHLLIGDWHNHFVFGSVFLFGFGLAKSNILWASVEQFWKPATLLAVGGYIAWVGLNQLYPDDWAPSEPWLSLARATRSAHMWGAIVALLALARRKLDRDTPARRYLTEAIFPYYIAHQTIIVLVGYALSGCALGPGTEFAVLLAATVAGCAVTHELVRRVGWLRPLFGLRPRGREPGPSLRASTGVLRG